MHKARNILERLPKPRHASVCKALRQACEPDDAERAERLIRNRARPLEQQAPGVAASILEGLDEILTVLVALEVGGRGVGRGDSANPAGFLFRTAGHCVIRRTGIRSVRLFARSAGLAEYRAADG
jgi:hypothetical protein